MTLLETDFLRQLERLHFVTRRIFNGRMRGERRSRHHGSSVEFADYRDYSPGDDLRHLDWKAYARFESIYTRLFVEEEDLTVYLLLDHSASMDFGSPHKGECAARVAAALGYIALQNMDRVATVGLNPHGHTGTGVLRGRGEIFRLLKYLQTLEFKSEGNLAKNLREFAAMTTRRGLVFVISDFLDPSDYPKALRLLSHSGFEIVCIQLLSPDEISPQVGQDVRLIDAETQRSCEVSLTRHAIKVYRSRLTVLMEVLDEAVVATGGRAIHINTADGFESAVMQCFQAASSLLRVEKP